MLVTVMGQGVDWGFLELWLLVIGDGLAKGTKMHNKHSPFTTISHDSLKNKK